MTRVTLHDDIEGHKSGETVDVPAERAEYYLVNGYASTPSYNREEHAEAGVKSYKNDPTLAENREDGPNPDVRDQLADPDNDLGRYSDREDTDDVRPVVDVVNPVELTNGDGDPEAGMKGKARVEKRQVEKTDPEDATEVSEETQETRTESADKLEAKEAKVEAAKDKADVLVGPDQDQNDEVAKKTASRQRR